MNEEPVTGPHRFVVEIDVEVFDEMLLKQKRQMVLDVDKKGIPGGMSNFSASALLGGLLLEILESPEVANTFAQHGAALGKTFGPWIRRQQGGEYETIRFGPLPIGQDPNTGEVEPRDGRLYLELGDRPERNE